MKPNRRTVLAGLSALAIGPPSPPAAPTTLGRARVPEAPRAVAEENAFPVSIENKYGETTRGAPSGWSPSD